MSEDERERILDLIYDAAIDASVFDDALRRLSILLNSSGALIEGFSHQREYSSFHNHYGLDPERKIIHEAFYLQNPWADVMVTKPEGRLYRSDDIVDLHLLKQTAFFADLLQPQDKQHGAMSVLANRPDFVVALHFMRGGQSGPFSDQEMETLAFFVPHLQRAAKLQLRVHEFSMLGQAKLDALDLVSNGVVLLDGSARIVFSNRPADDMFRSDTSSLRVTRDRNLVARSPRDSDCLRHLIEGTLSGGPGGVLLLSDNTEDATVVSIAPLRGQTAERLHGSALREPKVAVFVTDASLRRLPPDSLLAERFGLTVMETRVAGELASGRPLDLCSNTLGIGINTLKTHARRIYNKTETRGQAELTRMLLSLVPITIAAK